MTVENDKGEKEILIDAQSFQFGYRAAIKDMVGKPARHDFGPIATFLVTLAVGYFLFSLVLREK